MRTRDVDRWNAGQFLRRAFSVRGGGRVSVALRKQADHNRLIERYRARRIARAPFFELYPYRGALSHRALDTHTVVDLDLGILFHRIPKCANSSLATSIAQLNHDSALRSDQGFRRQMRQEFLRPSMMTEEQSRQVPNLMKFVFVRNPYTRLLSAYLSKVVPTWDRRKMRLAVRPQNADSPSVPTFEEFCRSLQAGALRRNIHWRPQTDFLIFPVQSYNLIGRVENISEDFRKITDAIGKRSNAGVMSEDPRHATGADRLQAQYYTAELYDLVYDLYKDDFETFGYSKSETAPSHRQSA